MSNEIINPLWIYLINTLSNLGDFLFGVLIFLVAGCIFGIIMYVIWRTTEYSPNYDEDVEKDKLIVLMLKRAMIILTLVSVLSTIVPSEKTMYTMLVANYVTVENLEITGDTITDMVDYIFEKVDELGEQYEIR